MIMMKDDVGSQIPDVTAATAFVITDVAGHQSAGFIRKRGRNSQYATN